MAYDLSMRRCDTCERETLHVRARRSLAARLGAMLMPSGKDRPAECVICGAIANPEERHPLRLRLDARGGLRHRRS